MNLPNKITMFRVVLIPFFILFMLCPVLGGADKYIAAAIFITASITDFIDGQLARRMNLVTNFGKFMDPLADKLLVCSALICLCGKKIPVVVVIIIISREFIISGFRLIASDKGVVIAAGWWGKVKTAVSMVMIIVVIIDLQNKPYQMLENVLIYASLILTVISLVDYLVKNKEVLKDEK
ncbi:CDP-diacylglycerol--glycerol-3-phosphate 3-phosphatidyltransferase [uncultured Eubacterium sp.]|uniref:CDP-diacylglycerol--glycerol-3-phosphate 3-phosphatidyltransferase n=1 Tax=uncultured Eubacterium sp. TaxID=165185 RepID=UPI000E9E75A7|nr:CDP-diacylglycerol--glycerol-3-phosphate 3-phosphatidyltransferase [uncultured Eubacterium sp.]HAV89771.1 CDP-diacylglycerol--glycerol-3-phosphate 3-phosphatidyltransferase [Eubacterium sp.]